MVAKYLAGVVFLPHFHFQKGIDAMKERHTVLKEDIFKMKDAGQDLKCDLVHAKLQAEEKKKAHRIAQVCSLTEKLLGNYC